MRLIDESVIEGGHLTPEERIALQAEEIKQLWQENEQLKEQINTAKIGWDTYKTYSEQLEQQTAESNKIIETQRQEIEKLKATLADWKYNAKCDADHIAALTTDKDELMKVLKQAREALYAARVDVLTKETDELARDAVEAIDSLIGGKEDV